MATSAFIIWDFTPEIFPSLFENFFIHPRWYGVLFASGFLLGYQLMKKFFIKEKENVELVDSLLMYVMVGTVLGARLGHVLFYDFADYIKNPISILYVWEGGLASHGAVIGNITAIYLWSRKFKKATLWTLDRVVITIAIAGALIRTGNFMNSEIYGDPTGTTSGVVFANSSTNSFIKNNGIASITTDKSDSQAKLEAGQVPLELTVKFDNSIQQEDIAKDIVENYLIYNFKISSHIRENIIINEGEEVDYKITKEGKNYVAQIPVIGIPRYPTQIYEAAAYVAIFLLLMYMYFKKGMGNNNGVIFGTFLVTIFGFRFLVEFFKANQSAFEEGLALNMGQILSIPCVLIGLYFIVKGLKKTTSQS